MITTRFKYILAAIAGLLLIPFIAKQFSSEVNWSAFDFLVMGILLLVTGIGIEFTLRKVTKFQHRVILCLLIFGAFLLVWAELAVGIFGSPLAGS